MVGLPAGHPLDRNARLTIRNGVTEGSLRLEVVDFLCFQHHSRWGMRLLHCGIFAR